MAVFKFIESGLTEIRKRLMVRFALIIVAMTAWSWSQVASAPDLDFSDPINYLPLLMPPLAIGIVFTFTMRRGMKRTRESLESYHLIIEDGKLVRTQHQVDDYRINTADITRIKHLSNGTIEVQAPPGKLTIPKYIGPRTELFAALANLHPVEEARANLLERYPAVLSVGTIGLMLGCWATDNPYIVVPCAIPLMVMLSWAFVAVRTDPNVGDRVKRFSWVTLIVVLAVGARAMLSMGISLSVFGEF